MWLSHLHIFKGWGGIYNCKIYFNTTFPTCRPPILLPHRPCGAQLRGSIRRSGQRRREIKIVFHVMKTFEQEELQQNRLTKQSRRANRQKNPNANHSIHPVGGEVTQISSWKQTLSVSRVRGGTEVYVSDTDKHTKWNLLAAQLDILCIPQLN